MNYYLNSNIISDLQKSVIKKSFYQTLYLLDVIFTNSGFILKITGSTLNVYSIYFDNNTFLCNCHSDKNLYCKHICFVICSIAKILNEYLFCFYILTPYDKNIIIYNIENFSFQDENLYNKYFFDKYLNIIKSYKINFDNLYYEHCTFCAKILKNDIFMCNICLNATHSKCIYLSKLSDKFICIYCKNNLKKNKYLNISK